jgi:hypothetical protein
LSSSAVTLRPVTTESAEVAPRVPPIRLRFVLLFGLLALGTYLFAPRAIAHWRLHGAATELANYGLCMAGPTGPSLLVEQPEVFWHNVRRRLIGAEASSRPFAACGKGFAEVQGDARRREAHAARADEFREYARYDGAPARHALADLTVTTESLERLLADARPFAPRDYMELLRTSLNAPAAPHPIDLPVPGRGRGLSPAGFAHAAVASNEEGLLLVQGRDVNVSALRSADGGKTWQRADTDGALVQALAGRCSTGADAPSFRLTAEDGTLRLESWSAGVLEGSALIGVSDATLIDLACDREAAVAAFMDEQRHRVTLKLCPRQKPCRSLERPAPLGAAPGAGATFAVARARGATVLALSREGVVRVASSRDDGQSWTPWTVAYDRGERGRLGASEAPPTRLLALGGRVLLYGTAGGAGDYPLLVSDDLGASWHTP